MEQVVCVFAWTTDAEGAPAPRGLKLAGSGDVNLLRPVGAGIVSVNLDSLVFNQ